MPRQPEESDLLVEFEINNLPEDYRDYYKTKRNNFFATIQALPEHWSFFCKIDEIWKRELTDLEVGTKTETAFPLVLFINAHSKIRIGMELAFSMCLQEARSVLRDAVESVAHAHHMLRDPANLKAWLSKDDPGGFVMEQTLCGLSLAAPLRRRSVANKSPTPRPDTVACPML